jgi:hypothetical protein
MSCRTNARNHHKSPLHDKLRQWLGTGLLTSEDDPWFRHRRIAQCIPAATPAQLADVMADVAREVVAEWHHRRVTTSSSAQTSREIHIVQ